MIREWTKRLGVLAALLLLSSCYIPDKFKSELRLSRYGDYALTFKGDLMWAPILDDYRKGKVTIENEQEKLDNIRKDLIRDIAVRKMESRGKGRFAVSAYYPTQYIFDRGYGNYLGFVHLGRFIGQATGLPLSRISIYIAHAMLGNAKPSDVSQFFPVKAPSKANA